MAKVLADTYALIAYLKGSPPFVKALGDGAFMTTSLNIAELAYTLRRRGIANVDETCSGFLLHVADPPPTVALDAARFRAQRLASGADCSTVDAWGYASAQHHGLPFLTGDEHFRGVPGVKFVKE